MKVYVITSAKHMCPEVYETVKSSFKEAEKYVRGMFPNARKGTSFGNRTSFTYKDNGRDSLMFILEEEIGGK